LADSSAVQLTRDPNALATALSLLATHADIPESGTSRSYLFMCGTERKPRGIERPDVAPGMFAGLKLEMHPKLDRRLKRLAAMGATSVEGRPSERSLLGGLTRLGIARAALWVTITSPLLLLAGLAALALVGAIFWLTLFTVEISLVLGLHSVIDDDSLAANPRTVTPMTALVLAAGATFVYVAWIYNRLVTLRNRTRNAWAQVNVQLRRRSDLVPNLVKCVKGYIAYEGDTLTTMTDLRRQAVTTATSIASRAAAEAELAQSLRLLLVAAEAVPQIRTGEKMLELQEELRATENRVAFARQHYNDSVMEYNAAAASVPTSLIARVFAFAPATMFSAPDVERRDASVLELSAKGSDHHAWRTTSKLPGLIDVVFDRWPRAT
jgi:LemA protein